jgi:hypothetical protein
LPAGALLAAIIAALVLLPSGSTPPPAPPTTSATAPTAETAKVSVARVSLIEPSSLNEDIPLANSTDPFMSGDSYDCTQVNSGTPKVLNCQIGDILVRVICPPAEGATGVCAEKAGSTGSAGGSTGSAGGTPSGSGGVPSGNGSTGGGTPGTVTYYYWAVTVKIDLKTYSNKIAGSQLPNADNPLAIFAGVNDDGGAVFLGASGVGVTGTPVDPNFNRFDLKKGQSATITDLDGKQHKFKVLSIKKVKK